MKVATIIVNYNDAEETVKYVKKISNYNIINKIVIVDNKSTDFNTIDLLKTLESDKVTLIQSGKNGGYAYGNNFGVKYLDSCDVKYDYIIVSNPDIDINENDIEKCIKVLVENEKIAVSAPRMYNSLNKPIRRSSWKHRTFKLDLIHSTRLLELLFYKLLRNGEYSNKDYEIDVLEVDAISGAFFIIKYDAFKIVNGFDENIFLFYEEDILAQKIKNIGYKIVSINNAKFTHYESQTIGKSFSYYQKMKQLYKSKMYYQINYNRINNFQKNVFKILYGFRFFELFFEIPIRKLFGK